MKRFILFLGLIVLGWQANAQNPIITGIVDACGSDGKFVELYVSGTVDFANYKLVRRSNANDWASGQDIDISALGSRTDEFVYVCRNIATLGTEFPSAGISASNAIEDSDISHNGDDSYRLVEIAGDVVIDQFGGDIDGSGEPWEYVDTWAARNSGSVANGSFTIGDWTFGTIDDLDAVGLCNDAANPPLESVAASIGSYTPASTSAYCTPAAFPNGCGSDNIDDFIIPNAGFSHLGTGCAGASTYADFTADPTLEIDLSQTVPYDFTINSNFSNQWVIIWIDLNNDDTFDVSERVYESTGGANPVVGTFSVPSTANLGTTRMRVINRWNSIPEDACNPFGTSTSAWGEVHDYTVNILAPPSCPQPTNVALTTATSDGGNFSWDGVTEADGGFSWEVYNQGDDPATTTEVASGTFPAGSTNGQVTGLAPITDYDLYITSICGTDSSATTGPIPFTTACATFASPYFEDFESFTVTTDFTSENCWNEISPTPYDWEVDSNGTDSSNTGPDGPFSGSRYLVVDASDGSDGDTATLESPVVDLTGLTAPSLTFYYHMYGAFITQLDVQVSGNGGAFNTEFTLTGEQQTASDAAWLQAAVDLSAYAGQTVVVRFVTSKSTNSGNTFEGDVAIDDVRFDELPSCFAPINLMASNITNNSVDLSWDADASETNGYEWVVMNSGDAPDVATAAATGTVGTGVLTANATGIPASSSYDAYVRTNCGTDGVSDWSAAVSFDTLCDAFPAPFVESFDASSIPNCWSQDAVDGGPWDFDGFTWNTTGCSDSPSDHTGNAGNFAAVDFSGTDTAVVLETPDIDVSALTVPYLEFYHFMCGTDYSPLNETYVEAFDGTNWNLVALINSGSASWEFYGFDLSGFVYNTDLVRLRFRAESGGSTDDFYGDVAIDDVSVDEAPPCIIPSNVTVTEVFGSEAELSWDGVANATLGYDWEVYLQGDTPGVDPVVSSGTFPAGSTTGQLTGLTELTDYDVYLVANCDADGLSSVVGPVAFTTIANCPEPLNLGISVVTNSSATFTWVESFNASLGYDYEIYAQGDDPTAVPALFTGTFPTGTSSGDFTGLTSDTAYDFYLASNCDADGTSAQAGPLSFSTLCDPIAAPYTEDFEAGTTTPACWIQGPNNVDGWEFGPGETYTNIPPGTESPSGGNNAHIDDSNPDAEETLFSPLVDVSGLTNPAFSFYWTSGDLGIYLPVDFRVDIWDGSAWNNVFERTSASGIITNGFEQVVVDLSTLTISGPIQARFISDEVEPGDFQDDIAIDDVTFGELPPPANDNACDAIPLTVGAPSANDAFSNVAATAEPNEPVPACFVDGINGSVWFTFVAPASGDVTVTTDIAGSTSDDTEIAVYDAPGDCADLTTLGPDLGCDQDSGTVVNFNSILSVSGLTPGNTYYIQVDIWNSTFSPDLAFGEFGIRVLDNNPACPEPTNLNVTGITDTSADLNWDDVTNATLGFNWEVYASPSDPTSDPVVASGSVGAGVTTANVTGLMPETSYDFYVVSDCDADGTSIFAGPSTFTTLPATVVVDCSLGTPVNTTVCYDNNADLIYTFTSTDGSPLRATFVEGYFEDCCDDIIIYDGLTTSDPILFQSDTNFNNDATGIEATSTGDSILVRIVSDVSVSCASGSGSPALNFNVGCVSTDELDYYNLQFPPDGNIALGDPFPVFAQAYEAGLTDALDTPAPGIEAWIGYSTIDSSPDTAADWTWVPATPNLGFDFTQNNDEYTLDLGATVTDPGIYYYASRWRLNGGPFTYGGILPDGSNGGEWGTNGFVSGVLTVVPPVGDSCTDPLIVGALPYSDTNDTANFTDFYTGSPGTNCGSSSSYLGGNDVVYSFTATFDGAINVELTGTGNWTGIFMYADCADIGVSCLDGGVNGSSGGDIVLNNIPVTNGTTYYFVVSTWPSPQTTPYTLNISQSVLANVQIIHNSADPAAQVVDVYVDGALTLDDFAFRTATPFVQLPAGTPIDIDVAPGGSTDVSESIYNLNATLVDGESYVVVANGVLDPTQFDESVNTPIAFNLDIFAGAQQASTNPGETSLLINHGSTDAPDVDAVEISVPAGTLADNLAYTQFAGYLDVPTLDFLINVETADNSGLVATYSAPLATLGTNDLALTVVASGFLDPAANQNGAAFGLWVALPTGGALVELPVVAPAAAAPDPTADPADVISLFSDAYTDVTVDTFLTPWSNAQLNDVQVQGNDVKRYHALDFAGIETVTAPVDASLMDFFHIDVWSPNATTFRVKLVNDLGGANQVEGEIAFNIAQEQWVSLQIPLTDFADPTLVTDPNNLLTGTDAIAQYIISGLPAGAVVAHVDNIYFSKVPIGTVGFEFEDFSYYPSPAENNLYLQSSLEVEQVKVFNMLGQLVITETPNALTPTINVEGLQAGTYIMNVTIDGETKAFKFIKE